MIAPITGACLALFTAAAAFTHLRTRSAPRPASRVLRWSAIATTIGVVVALLPSTLSDSGAATTYLLGVPVAIAAATAAADLTGRAAGFVTTAAALLMLAWSLLLGLGPGSSFALPALVLGAAALAGTPARAKIR